MWGFSNMKNKIGLLMVFVLAIVVMSTSAMAVVIPVEVDNVEIDGSSVDFWGATSLDIKRGEEFDVDFELYTVDGDLDDVEVEVTIRGYDHNDRDTLTEIVGPFNMRNDTVYRKSVTLRVPERIEEDTYLVRFIVFDRHHEIKTEEVVLTIDNSEHEMMIKDVVFSPENGVKPGRALLAAVRVRNYGQDDEESVKVSVAIPALGVSASDYIDEIEVGDTETSEELFIRVPQTAKPGVYDAVVTVEYNDGDDEEVATYEIEVVPETEAPAPAAQETTFVSGEVNPMTGKVGETLSYPITISNVGSSARTYAITVSPVEWATFKISPTNLVVVEGGQSKIVYLYVTPKQDTEGEQVFVTNVRSGDIMKQVVQKAVVTPAEEEPETGWAGLRKSLEIGLVVLVVLLVILGLVIVFNKLTGPRDDEDDEDEDDEAQTYY
jgi:hypothetical protein